MTVANAERSAAERKLAGNHTLVIAAQNAAVFENGGRSKFDRRTWMAVVNFTHVSHSKISTHCMLNRAALLMRSNLNIFQDKIFNGL